MKILNAWQGLSIHFKVQYLSSELLGQPTGGNVPSQLLELTPGQAHRLHLLYPST